MTGALKADHCPHCTDEDGVCMFPMYGVAPHAHDFNKTGSWIGSTRIFPKELWPVNFQEDPDAPGCGTYTHCPICGRAD